MTIVGNLVDNAIDHLSDGAIGGGEIEVAIWHENGAVRIDVLRFRRGDLAGRRSNASSRSATPRRERPSHEGFGLAFVRELIDRYDGSIEVDSEVGSGSLFSVRLSLGGSTSRQEVLVDV